MSESSSEFTDLLARARGGDREALHQLARDYEPKLRLVARVLLGPALRPYLDSVDLVQSVHRSLLLGLRQDKFAVAGPENLMALALTLVRRKVARQWRRAQRQRRQGGADGLAEVLTSLSSPEAARLAREPGASPARRAAVKRLDQAQKRFLAAVKTSAIFQKLTPRVAVSPVQLLARPVTEG